MALLNAIITYGSLEDAQNHFELIKNLEMQFCLPDKISVNNCFLKIKKEKRSESRVNEWDTFQSTVAFREYAYLDGSLKIAVNTDNFDSNVDEYKDLLKKWFMHINYFGKRGCFFQFNKANEIEALHDKYSSNLNSETVDLQTPSIMFLMDDFGRKATFDKVNSYSSARTDRENKIFLFPYYIEKSNNDFTLYSCY
jgi:hypothetical protein